MRRAILGFLLGTAMATPALAGTPAWTISEASQGVMINHAGQLKPAMRGGHAAFGDVITTGPNARAVLVRGEEYAVIAPNSRLQVADPAASGGLTQFLERLGNVVFSVKKMTNPHFGVQTPYLAAVVKGTTFSVTVDDNGASVQVVEGAVEVATHDGGARELVRPGTIASVGAGDMGALTLQGSTMRTIRAPAATSSGSISPSPSRSGAGSEASNSAVPAISSSAIATPVAEASTAPSLPAASRAATGSVAISAVNEPSTSLTNLTGGLVSGQTSGGTLAAATSSVSGADRAVAVATNKPTAVIATGNASSNAGGNGAGNGNANANAGGNSASTSVSLSAGKNSINLSATIGNGNGRVKD